MKINRLFSIAAATMMMVACSSEDTALKNTPAAGPQMQFTATIAAPGSGATTRTEYTEVTTGEAAGTINVAWKVGDEIALIHNGVKDVATVEKVNEDGSATITGIITKAENGDGVEVCYPAALWDWDDNTKGAIRNATFIGNITKQDGTLEYIQDNLDVRMVKGRLNVDGDNATLSASATLKSQIAIWKLTLQDDAETPAALSATQVILKVGDPAVTIASTTEDLSKTSTVYLAMDRIDEEDLTIEATVGEDTYVYTQNGVILEHGNYYQSTVTMEKKAASTPLDNTTTAWTAGTFAVPAGGLTYSDAITVSGDVTLTLTDGETLTLNKGISLASGATLTVKGNGTMNVNGTNNSTASTVAGTGTLVLTSGTLNAKGGNGQGVGNRSIDTDNRANAGGNAINGNVTVSGGTLTATGGNGGGVGTSTYDSYGAVGGVAISGSVTVTGGTVTATGGNGGGVGSRSLGSHGGAGGAAIGGDATISGGTWTASNGTHGENGYGEGGDGGKAVAGTVTDNR